MSYKTKLTLPFESVPSNLKVVSDRYTMSCATNVPQCLFPNHFLCNIFLGTRNKQILFKFLQLSPSLDSGSSSQAAGLLPCISLCLSIDNTAPLHTTMQVMGFHWPLPPDPHRPTSGLFQIHLQSQSRSHQTLQPHPLPAPALLLVFPGSPGGRKICSMGSFPSLPSNTL